MRRLIVAMLVLGACSDHPSRERSESAETPPVTATAPVTDLVFNDWPLQAIAAELVRQARARGIEASSGRNRIERLLSLEASLGDSGLARSRVNKLFADMTMTDGSQWAKLRRRAAGEFAARDTPAARRVGDLLDRWQRHRLDVVFDYLSSNYSQTYIHTMEWERRFHDFVRARPMDAATWGWLVLRADGAIARKQYGRADSETAYRFYLESSGLGDGREAREIFSLPGITMD